MPEAQKVSSSTVACAARELVGAALEEGELAAVAALVGALALEMAPMRAMDLAPVEPATTYDPGEP